ncbi:MAG: polysaccharide biosynthesis/export family protein [Cyclobacteriaceae bacterium]
MKIVKLTAFLLSVCLSSCISNRNVVYFPDPDFNTGTPVDIVNERQVYRLQPRDVVSVRIKTVDVESANYFNIQPETGFQQFNDVALYLNGYSLNEEGYIQLPEVGKVLLSGLTLQEAQQKVQQAFSDYINNATIMVKLVSFKITVLGEVNRPGYYYIYNDQANLLEGIGIAGDLTDFGNRENITLIRQTQAGSEAILLNLKDPGLLSSDYYFLQPNDVLYVQPLQEKNTRDNLGTLPILSILFGAVSSTILLLGYVNR